MNAKQMKFYTEMNELFRLNTKTDAAKLVKSITSLLEIDFSQGIDVYEYICTACEKDFGDSEIANIYGHQMLLSSLALAEQRTIKAIMDNAAIRRAVYQYSSFAGVNETQKILVDLILASKVDDAEEILKCMLKNTATPSSFGKLLKEMMEKLYLEIQKKSATKRVELNRKQATLLANYVAKVKTEEKAMLEQRLREVG